MREGASLSESLDHLSHQTQEPLHDISWVGEVLGEVGKDAAALDYDITEKFKQNSLRPGRILILLPIGFDNVESTSIKHLQIGR